MTHFWLTLISITLLISVNSQSLLGTWFADWQNQYADQSAPQSMQIVAINTTFFNVSYPGTVYSNWIQNSTANTWVDAAGGVLTYDAVTNTITYPFMNGTTTSTLLYESQPNASVIDQELVVGFIGGTWINPVPAASSLDQTGCCMPSSVFVNYLTYQANSISFAAAFEADGSDCSDFQQEFTYTIGNAGYHIISLNGVNWTNTSYGNVQFSPLNNTYEATWTFMNSGCSYNYTRFSQSQLLYGKWVKDWQTTSTTFDNIASYQVNMKNNLYMTSTTVNTQGVKSNGIVVQRLDGTFYDHSIQAASYYGANFTFDSQSNSVTFQDPSTTFYNILFTQTGSQFSAAPFVSYWDNPQTSSFCCLPYAISISNDTAFEDELAVSYYFSTNAMTNNSACNNLVVTNGTIQSYLSITSPNASQLTWTDAHGTQIAFTNTTTASEIQVSYFNGPCTFTMQATSSLPPKPLSSAMISSRIAYLVAGLALLFASL